MITDNPDTNSRPAKSPSTRPMTLRQQITPILKKYGLCKCGRHKTSPNFAYHVCIEQGLRFDLERLCQEIAREARLDELNMMANHSWSAHRTYLFDRIAELTQKPPQPQGADSHTDTGDTVSGNEADNLSPGANGADNTKFPYYCPVCGEGYTQMLYRDNHVANKHTKGTDLVPPEKEPILTYRRSPDD